MSVLPEPGSGTGRPCYIAHDAEFPERECDGLHGVENMATFYALESAAVITRLRHQLNRENTPTPARRFALETRGAFGAWWSALVDVAAFIFTLGYINHITDRRHCPHCRNR